MNDPLVHVLLFLVVGVAIVTINTFFAESEDARALRSLPLRLLKFCLGCGIVAGVMLLVEHTVASVS